MRAYDLLVIGGGAGGLIAAKTAGKLGARVALIDRNRPGGDCLWTGCVPSKSLIAAANAAHTTRSAAKFGITADEPRVDFPAVMSYVHSAIARAEPADSPEALADAGAGFIAGDAEFVSPGQVRVDGRVLPFRNAVVATGSSPALPPVAGLAEVKPLTTDTVWDIEELPARLAVLGGGPVGCELAQAFARLGSEVTIVEADERLLGKEEPDASRAVAEALSTDGVRLLTSATVTEATGGPGSIELRTSGPGGAGTVAADAVLVAAGRSPHTARLGLDSAGVRVDERGHVPVDAKLRTSNRRVYAAGDVTGALPFTHVAGMHGSIAATNALLAPRRRMNHDQVPWVTFTDPEVAHVGLTERQARQRHGDAVRVRLLRHEHVDRAITEDDTGGFTHIVLGSKGNVLGASIVAPRAGEMIAELASLIAGGGRLRDLSAVVHAYPSWSDGVWNAAVAESEAALARPLTRRLVTAVIRLRRAGTLLRS